MIGIKIEPIHKDTLYYAVNRIRHILNKEMLADGFVVYQFLNNDSLRKYFYCIEPTNINYNNKAINKLDDNILSIAREYGWIITDTGLIVGYDETKHIRHKHLLTGSNLGLL